ncbi:hypothetical protein GQ53DRAFT_108855 [Thozetella sp. PMI_491]|nr:hypothetical protein GQ53DRAFT_108855 [Thozetella sp. PMI_491]
MCLWLPERACKCRRPQTRNVACVATKASPLGTDARRRRWRRRRRRRRKGTASSFFGILSQTGAIALFPLRFASFPPRLPKVNHVPPPRAHLQSSLASRPGRRFEYLGFSQLASLSGGFRSVKSGDWWAALRRRLRQGLRLPGAGGTSVRWYPSPASWVSRGRRVIGLAEAGP